MSTIKLACFTALALLFLFAGVVKAQTAEPEKKPVVYHPGQTIAVVVTFEGKDADQITSAAMSIAFRASEPPKDQSGFSTQIYQSSANKVGPNQFKIEFKIPDTQATGDYELNQIRAIVFPANSVVLFYNAPADFSPRGFRVENPKTFDKPKIKDVQVP